MSDTNKTSPTPLIQLESVNVRNDRDELIFRDLNFILKPGESAIICGAAGSGKTLLAEVLIGLRFAESGTVRLFGDLITKRRRGRIRRIRRKIGGVGGHFDLVPSLSVADNIRLPMIIAGERHRLQQERLRKMLTEFSILKQAGEMPGTLTRVENYLVQFARASVASQPLLMVDEPTAGLDQKTYRRIMDFLVKVSVSGRSMVILTSEPTSEKIPNTRSLSIVNGALQ